MGKKIRECNFETDLLDNNFHGTLVDRPQPSKELIDTFLDTDFSKEGFKKFFEQTGQYLNLVILDEDDNELILDQSGTIDKSIGESTGGFYPHKDERRSSKIIKFYARVEEGVQFFDVINAFENGVGF